MRVPKERHRVGKGRLKSSYFVSRRLTSTASRWDGCQIKARQPALSCLFIATLCYTGSNCIESLLLSSMEHILSSLFVVLVEPSHAQAKIIQGQFSDLGISQYERFDQGQTALEAIFRDVPDLVISAMYLPDMSGKDLVLKMREHEATVNTPFMLISTETAFEALDPIKQAGASAVLPKPFQARDLQRAVNTTMDWEETTLLKLDDYDPENLEVLVVDDSAMARKMICRTLGKMGIENMDQAVDGKQGIDMIAAKTYDLIITDYNMPEVDGHEFLRYIRNQSSQSSVPVLMVTTEGNQSVLSAIQQDGVSAIFDKPFETEQVKKMIETVLSFE